MLNIMDDAVWITWERQIRNRSASSYFNVPLFEIIEESPFRVARYAKSILKTISIITKEKPRYFFAQNPSVVLAVLAVTIKKVAKCKVIIDAHNAGIHGAEESNLLIQKLNRFIVRAADAVIVTNSELGGYVRDWGGTAIIMPDPLPALSYGKCKINDDNSHRLKAFCITSWSDDEPYLEILAAAEQFAGEVDFYFSGNFRKIQRHLPKEIPENVNLLGFVDESTFHQHLFSADFCIDMTKRSDCMVCGAYESIAAEKPVILSDSPVQRAYFSKGAVFSQSTTPEIVDAISRMKDRIHTWKEQAIELKREILEKEEKQKSLILTQIQSL